MNRQLLERAHGALAALLVTLLAILGTTEAAGQTTPPSMSAARGAHTATLLASGKVLVAGGNDANGRVASTEVYDPASNLWTPAGSLNTPRFFHTATLLPNGKVLLAGGTNGAYLGSAELYDPATNTWSPTGSMLVPRYQHNATLLANGKVLVAGGNTATGATASVEIYDPATGNWGIASALSTARYAHTATLLASGRVLVAGGSTQTGPSGTVEVYDPATNSWTVAASLAVARSDHTATLLANGNVLVAGGDKGSPLPGLLGTGTAERYDPVGNVWTAAGTLSVARKFHTMTRLVSGKVIVAGGNVGGSSASANVDQYDPATNSWTTTSVLAARQWGHSATLLNSGKLLVTGGYSADNGYLTKTELYDPATNSWGSAGSLGTARLGHTATLLPSGKILIVGGTAFDYLASTELFDPATNTSAVMANLATARSDHAAILLLNGKVLVVGGYNGELYLASAELYDPATNRWTAAAPIPSPYNIIQAATLLASGKVLVMGERLQVSLGPPHSQVSLYDPATNTWTSGPLWNPLDLTATRLGSGDVLLVGGSVGSGPVLPVATVGLYGSTAGTLVPAASLPRARTGHIATLLANGKVLVAGGGDIGRDYTQTPAGPLLYDPQTNTWASGADTTIYAPTLGFQSNYLFATLPSGEALRMFESAAEIYDAATNRWTPTVGLTTLRSEYTATVLPSGKVLVSGGGSGGLLRNVELYDPKAAPIPPPPPGPPTVPVIEFYNAGQDHFFVSSLSADINALDTGFFPGWARTGLSFNAYPITEPGASPVCRFYIPPAQGDSHFYSASPTECAQVTAKFPTFILESSNVMYMGLPDATTGACATGWTSVYRLWDNRGDSNHRYTTDRTTRNQMVAKGWIAEGYGPDPVIMCAPP